MLFLTLRLEVIDIKDGLFNCIVGAFHIRFVLSIVIFAESVAAKIFHAPRSGSENYTLDRRFFELGLVRIVGVIDGLGERGAGLSGGERQRLSIARALLLDPRILILDEATSSVDTESEQAIQRSLDVVGRGRTTIAIAHRLSTLRSADCIFVVADGGIAESGTHNELMKAEGIYFNLVRIQTELARVEE